MSVQTDAQDDATYNAKGSSNPNAEVAGQVKTLSPTTAVGFQVSTKRDAYLYINIRTAAALATAISADGSTYSTLDASQSDAIGMTTLFVPKGWYVKLTGTMANLAVSAVLV